MNENMPKKKDMRIAALRRFAAAITILTILGHGFLGFEQSYAYVLVALMTGYSVELLLETLDAWANGRKARYLGGFIALFNFMLPAHITSLAVSMLLYSNERLLPIAFAVAVAVGSKNIFRVMTAKGSKHFLNPSNTGISITLILFPWVSIAPPYQFVENISGVWDWLFPLFLIIVGTFLNARFTARIPLISAWLIGFAVQAVVRGLYFGTPILAGLNPMMGLAFLLFTFYMVSDPGTTPFKLRDQIIFGSAVALAYGILMLFHVVFTLFFALFAVCILRGMYIYACSHLPLWQTSFCGQSIPQVKEVAS